MLKTGELFWAKFKAFGDRFLRIRYQHKRIPKNLLPFGDRFLRIRYQRK